MRQLEFVAELLLGEAFRPTSFGDALAGWFKSISEEQLNSALPKDFESLGANYGALMSTIAWYEGLHTGQLTLIRKSLGIAPKFA